MKLEGYRVLDLSMFLPGPWLTQVMADHGAEVIKVEPPSGEPVRTVGYVENGWTTWYRNTHRGKKSVMLDLKKSEDHAAFLRLAAEADVVVEAFRPGVVDRLGIGYDAICAVKPDIVYASISAFGQTGPERLRPGHDLAIEALSGVVSLNLGKDGEPTNPHMPVADITGSMAALSGILMALLRRERTGQGDYLDISMQDATVAWLPNVVGPVFAEGRAPDVKAERSFGGYAFFSVYRTRDGGHVCLGGVEHKFVENFLNAVERPDLIPLALGPNGPGQTPVKDALTEIFLTRTRDAWDKWARGRDLCFAPVLDLKEALDHPQLAVRDMILTGPDGSRNLGTPLKFRNEPGRLDLSLAELGQHNRDLLGRD